MAKDKEGVIENHLKKRMESIGGKCYKWNSMGNKGVPDRICCFPDGSVIFAELKAPNKKASPLQEKVIKELVDLGCNAAIFDSKEQIDKMLISFMQSQEASIREAIKNVNK